jgi:hypothetical protein
MQRPPEVDLDGIAEALKGERGGAASAVFVEMVGTKILVEGAVLEHVADRGEDRGDKRPRRRSLHLVGTAGGGSGPWR